MKLTEFEFGYVIACANVVNAHSEPGIAADVMAALGVTWPQIVAANLSEYDMAALREIKKEKSRHPFLDGRTKDGRHALRRAMKLTADDYLELRFLAKKGLTYPKAAPGNDQQLDRLASAGLIVHSNGLWRITDAGRRALEGGER